MTTLLLILLLNLLCGGGLIPDTNKRFIEDVVDVPPMQGVSRRIDSLTIEIAVIVDYSIYQKWLRLHRNNAVESTKRITNFYLRLFTLLEGRMRLVSLENFVLKTKLVRFSIAHTPDEVPYINSGLKAGELDGEAVIMEFWHRVGVGKSDLTIIFTNYDMYNSNGMSFEGSLCKRNAVSLVKENNTLNLLNTVSHEIVHILGSGHDGEGNDCDAGEQFLMAPFRHPPANLSHTLNHLRLSTCSQRSVVQFLEELERNKTNCLKVTKF